MLTVVTAAALIAGILIAIIATVIANGELASYEQPTAGTIASISAWQTVAGWCVGIGSLGLIATLAVRALLAGFGKLEEPLPERPRRKERLQ